ncbi:MAG TPA: hypothetical protein VI757_02605 [Bacteroidia bacterium]|nr:hypothetical protein [Bacteroidia bacterium]
MKTPVLKLTAVIFLITVTIIACNKKDDDNTPNLCTDGIQNQGETGIDCGGPCAPCPVIAAKSFSNVTFTYQKMFFSTAGSSTTVLDSNQAKLVASTIDLTYTWDNGYDAAGFLDPITRSSSLYYWSPMFQTTWTNVSKEVIWYQTTLLNYLDGSFTAAKNDQSKIGQYFADTTTVSITTHTVWPTGTCVGGRNTTTGFSDYQIFAFKRVADGKRGLVEIVSAPTPVNYSRTIVNIIVEN